MDSCTEIPQEDYFDLLLQPPPWITTILLTVTIVITVCVVIIIYRCRTRIYKDGVCCPCCVGCCGVCCAVREAKSKDSSTISLVESGLSMNSSTELLLGSKKKGEQLNTITKVEGEVFTNHRLYVDDIEEDDNGSDTESNVNIFISKSRKKESGLGKPLAFSDLLCLSTKAKALAQLYIEDKKVINNLDYKIFRETCELFYVMIQHVVKQVVSAEIKDKMWMEDVESVVTEALSKARKRWQSICVAAIEGEEMKIPDTLQVDLKNVTVHLTDHLHKTLEDCDMAHEETVSSILLDFENNWAVFEHHQAEIGVKQVKQLEKDLRLRKQIVTTLYNERAELIKQLLEYKDKQVTHLDRIQNDVHTDRLHKMRTMVDDSWESTLNVFSMELRRESSLLSLQLQTQLDIEESHGTQSLERNIIEKKEALTNGRLSLSEFTTEYCDLASVYIKGKCARKKLELQLVGSQFSALVEHSGVKTLKAALDTEKRTYKDYLQRTNWVTPQASQSIKGNLVRLKGLKASLKKLRGRQHSALQAMVKQTSTEEPSTDTFCRAEIVSHQASIKGVVERQSDFTEIECQQLVDHCIARLKMFEIQLELSKLGQERKLQELMEVRKDELHCTLDRETEGIPSANEAVVIANMKFRKEEQRLQESYEKAHTELKSKLAEETKSTLLAEHFAFQKQIEKLRRKHEKVVSLANKKEMAINALKSKLVNKLSGSKDKDIGDQILHQHQVNTAILAQTISKTKDHQNQVLIQKLQAKKLEKQQEKERELKQQQPPCRPYRPGSAKSFVSTTLVSWLYSVRHKRAMEALEVEFERDEKHLKSKMAKQLQADAKLELQVHETEVIVKLASALNMTHSELENELKKSVIEQAKNDTDQETCSLVTKSVLDLFSHAY